MQFRDIMGCPVPEEIADAVTHVGEKSGATLQSCYRGTDPNAQPILRKHGKQNQVQLWNKSQIPGSGIRANRPGQSTHECFNDGVAYRGRVGAKLKPEQVGQDWEISKVRSVIAAYNEIGIEATLTYPNSNFERQHINIRKYKPFRLFKPLKAGMKSVRVGVIRKNLALVRSPTVPHPTYLPSAKRSKGNNLFFDDSLYHALRAFQRDHGLKDDGLYGYRTAQQLAASVRHAKKNPR